MSTGGSHLEGPLDIFLTTHIGEIEVEFILMLIELLSRIDDTRLWRRRSVEESYNLEDVVHTIDLESVDDGSLVLVSLRDDKSLEVVGPRLDGYRQRTLDGLQMTVEP